MPPLETWMLTFIFASLIRVKIIVKLLFISFILEAPTNEGLYILLCFLMLNYCKRVELCFLRSVEYSNENCKNVSLTKFDN